MVGVGARAGSSGQSKLSGGDRWCRELDEILDALAKLCKRTEPVFAVGFSQRAQQVFAGIEAAKLADMKAAGASDRKARETASAGGTRSKKASSRAAKRADAVAENPALAGEVESGSLGEEQMDAIAAASKKTDGDAARDPVLLGDIKSAPVDDAGKITSRWLEKRDDDGTRSRHERQRARRGVRFGFDPASGCDTMTAQGDTESIRELQRAVKELADVLYRNDGGRELPPGEHPRTHGQRMYDALHQLLAGAAGSTAAAAGAGSGGVRAMLHVNITVDDADADLVRAHVIGGDGYLPQSVLDKYGCAAMVAGTVFDQRGDVLWHGRQRRHATPAQFSALVARDGGCVKCGADPSRCEAHHLDPFNAPKRGETNVEDMALMCADDHHWLHEQQLTLYWQLGPPDPTTGHRKRVWRTRLATPDEIAPHAHAGRPTPDKRRRTRHPRARPTELTSATAKSEMSQIRRE